ncbi:MAG TPA: fused MFS/spermidine synthase [Polyangiales bacterium]
MPPPGRIRDAAVLCSFAMPAFLGAALFMLLQLLVGRVLLPQLGGAPGVWVSCLAFFQLTLCAGYAWVHLATRRSSRPVSSFWQPALVLAVLASGPLRLPPVAADYWSPTWTVLRFLIRHVALPSLVLSTTAPMLQTWYFAVTQRAPFALYAVSNAGSFAGLLAYPLLIEPRLLLHTQRVAWSYGFGLYALLMAAPAVLAWRRRTATLQLGGAQGAQPASCVELRQALGWLGLSAAPTALLAAITNHISVDVPAGPLVWAAPLALYLASFVVAFARERSQQAQAHEALWIACTVALPILLLPGNEARLPVLIGVPLLTLWVGSMLCHSKLAQRRPVPEQLTAYYACIAAGGALGGGAVAFVAPHVFSDHYELVLSLIGVHALHLTYARRRDRRSAPSGAQRLAWLGFGLAMPVLVATLWVQVAGLGRSGQVLARTRNFFGPLQVFDAQRVRVLAHGRTDQGQALRDPARSREPVGYVGKETGVGRALRLHATGRPRELGVLGLGVGALATYARAGDSLRFYEINPDVAPLARRWFGFLDGTRAALRIVSGDGRIALSREPHHGFDVFVLDAFSSDAIPAHLLTLEAFAVYLGQLAPDGVLVVNVSNRHLDVERVVAGSARALGLPYHVLQSRGDAKQGLVRARWVVMARSQALLQPLLGGETTELPVHEPVLWTDDHMSILSIVR